MTFSYPDLVAAHCYLIAKVVTWFQKWSPSIDFWWGVVAVRCFIVFVIVAWFQKWLTGTIKGSAGKNTGEKAKTQAQLIIDKVILQYAYCSIIATTLLFLTGREVSLDNSSLVMILIGFGVGIGAYFNWRAVGISQSRNSVFTFWDDITAMALGYVILNESQYLNITNATGVILGIVTILLFACYRYRNSEKEDKELEIKFFLFVGVYSFLWGTSVFLIRWFQIKNVDNILFIWYWYTGTLLSSLALLYFRGSPRKNAPKMVTREKYGVLVTSTLIMLCLWLNLITIKQIPLIILIPIYLVGEMIVPTLMGLYFFKEIEEMKPYDIYFYLAGFTAGILVILGSH